MLLQKGTILKFPQLDSLNACVMKILDPKNKVKS